MDGRAKMLITCSTPRHAFEFPALVMYRAGAGQGLNGLCPFQPVPIGTKTRPADERSRSRRPPAHHPEVQHPGSSKKLGEVLAQRPLLRRQGLQLGHQRPHFPGRCKLYVVTSSPE